LLSPRDRQSDLSKAKFFIKVYWEKNGNFDFRSVGVILYECVFGKAPYKSESLDELLIKIRSETPIVIPNSCRISDLCQGVNFINIVQAPFLFESAFRNFLYLHFGFVIFLAQESIWRKKLHVKCRWNWLQISSRNVFREIRPGGSSLSHFSDIHFLILNTFLQKTHWKRPPFWLKRPLA